MLWQRNSTLLENFECNHPQNFSALIKPAFLPEELKTTSVQQSKVSVDILQQAEKTNKYLKLSAGYYCLGLFVPIPPTVTST